MWKTLVLLLAVLSCFSCKVVENEVAAATPRELEAEGPEQRIIGGTITNIERYPYVVQVWQNNSFKCGGSLLLTLRHVLSVAHCFVNSNGQLIDNRQFTVRAGTATLNSGGHTRSVSKIIIHERYNVPNRDNDIAILLLSSRFTGSATIGSQVLRSTALPDNAVVWYVGWGTTFSSLNPNVILSERLQEVAVNVVNQNICTGNYLSLNSAPGTENGRPFIITNNMMCAGALGIGGRDACTGDSGGPVVYNNVIVGITSWGYGCGEPSFPGVNVRLSNYMQWINTTVTMNGSTASKASVVILLASLISALRFI